MTAYLATVTKQPWIDVLKAIKQKRSIANPNDGFRKQLFWYEAMGINDERQNLNLKFKRYSCRPNHFMYSSSSKKYQI